MKFESRCSFKLNFFRLHLTNDTFPDPRSRSLDIHNDDTLDDYEDSSFDEEETGEHPGQKVSVFTSWKSQKN